MAKSEEEDARDGQEMFIHNINFNLLGNPNEDQASLESILNNGTLKWL